MTDNIHHHISHDCSVIILIAIFINTSLLLASLSSFMVPYQYCIVIRINYNASFKVNDKHTVTRGTISLTCGMFCYALNIIYSMINMVTSIIKKFMKNTRVVYNIRSDILNSDFVILIFAFMNFYGIWNLL